MSADRSYLFFYFLTDDYNSTLTALWPPLIPASYYVPLSHSQWAHIIIGEIEPLYQQNSEREIIHALILLFYRTLFQILGFPK